MASDTLFVVCCAGLHCNGADKAALQLSQLGKRVKAMIGGMTVWADEGLSYAPGPEPRSAIAARMPLTPPVMVKCGKRHPN
ncbi:MAG TPA: hypothetical protein VKT99_22285 [Xanthobacteraceae bacterium]|jgi:hypothetical protein|nr:hypothetical protein [Xanthobacteraceae bacterium]